MRYWPYPKVVAHRGGGDLAPENTLGAIDTGACCGHTMIEFDVKLSADEQLFLLHDDTLERTTNSHGIAGDLTWDTLARVDAGSWFGPEFTGERVPLLRAVAERCQRYGMMANIEIKPAKGQDAKTGAAVALAARELWSGQIAPLLSSFSIEALEAARQAVPSLPRGVLLDSWREDWQQLTERLDCLSIHLNHHVLDAERVKALKAAGLFILVYTVNDPARAALLLQWGVDSLCTDRIDQIGPDFVAAASCAI